LLEALGLGQRMALNLKTATESNSTADSFAAVASVLGALRRRSFERPFKYKKEEQRNALIYLDRDGQFLSEN
jgi:hypothetical protein